jgi:gliding-associated putative ABC transporter substrate-binding component GldG
MKNKKTILTQVLLIVAVLVIINVLSEKFFFRLDFTADQRYTLSEATKNILESMDEPVTVTAYFTEDLPPDFAVAREDFKDLLIEYDNRSGGKVLYEFIDPKNNQEIEQRAYQAGIAPLQMNMREKDEIVLKKIYMGAVVQLGDKSEPIPAIQPGSSMEYDLSSAIKKLSIKNKPSVGFVQGHGEPSLASLGQVRQELEVLYTIEAVDLGNSETDLNRFNALIILGPTDTIPGDQLQKLDNYLAGGGHLFIGIDRVKGDFTTVQGTPINTGLETWLGAKGLNVESNFVIDANCGTVSIRQGNFPFPVQVPFPYIPKIQNFTEHPITQGIEQILFQFTSSISYTGDTTLRFEPILKSSKKSGTKSTPLYFEVNKRWNENDFPLSGITVGAVLEGNIVGNNVSRIVLVSDGQFVTNGEGQNAQQVSQDNVSLLANAVDWLSDDTGLIDLRTKGVSSRPLDQIEDSRKNLLKWLNFLLPIFLILVYGIFRMQRRRNLRVKRMEKGYV